MKVSRSDGRDGPLWDSVFVFFDYVWRQGESNPIEKKNVSEYAVYPNQMQDLMCWDAVSDGDRLRALSR